MKPRKPIPKKRRKPRRVLGREKLYGKAKEARRLEIFERSGGRCEAIVRLRIGMGAVCGNPVYTFFDVRCRNPITWETMEWSHKRHGANKDDSLEGGIASCRECHQRQHNPKSCPAKERVNA